ncbi:MAG: sulfurtransferase-like selenium metabolism protein YedF [Alkaliphilus sp.]
MRKEVDGRGLECPLPVINTKKALEGITEGIITTVVDNAVAKENIVRLAKSMTYKVNIAERQGNYHIDIFKNQPQMNVDIMDISKKTKYKKDLTILITKDCFGDGAKQLGEVLMKGYLYTLTEVDPKPKTIIFLNSGVNLVIEGSNSLNNIEKLQESGVEIISCGTCLDYYKIKDKLSVGIIGNMYDIAEKMSNSAKTITL